MFEIPTTLTIANKEFGIRDDGDYRMVLDCFEALQDPTMPKRERLITAVVIFYDGFSLDNAFNKLTTSAEWEEAVSKMYDFFNCGQKPSEHHTPYKLIDWEQDNHLIASALNKTAGFEIREVEYMHWWTFMGLYISIGESVLSSVVSIRSKMMEGKKLEKHEKEFRMKNPEYFVWNRDTVEQQEADAWLKEIWNKE